MAVGYRAVLRISDEVSAVKSAREQLYSWLVVKKRDRRSSVSIADWEGPGRHLLGEHAVLDVVHGEHEHKGDRRLYRLTETNESGTWPVSLYAMDLPGSGGVIVVEAGLADVDEDAAMGRVSPPRIVRSLLDAVPVKDGRTAVHGTPSIVAETDAEEIFEAITDPARVVAVVVAPSPGIGLEERWRDVVGSLTRESAGVSTAFVLRWNDVHLLNDRMPRPFRVEPGRVRTFLPGVDLDNFADAKRHPILGPITLSRSLNGTRVSDRLAKIHAAAVRRRLLEFGLPSDVRRGIELLHRIETRMRREVEIRERVAIEPALAEQRLEHRDGRSDTRGAIDRLAQRWLGVDQWMPEHLDRLDELLRVRTAEAQVAAESIESLERIVQSQNAELEAARQRYDDLEFDIAELDEQAQKYERETVELRRRLLKANLYEEAYVAQEEETDWSAPVSVEELVNRITAGKEAHAALRWVEYTGDRSKAAEIDRRDRLGRVASRLWEYVRVLHDYAELRASGFSGNVDTYLNSDSADGFRCSRERHASNESDTVRANPRWSAERLLPVPTTVDPSGTALMTAHFKVTYLGQFAPRLHYCDDTARSGKIYIGYIGRHLTNTLT